MILPDHMIRDLCLEKRWVPTLDTMLMSNPPQQKMREVEQTPMIEPYNEEQLQPASYDVRLFDEFRVSEPHDEGFIDMHDVADITKLVRRERFVIHPGEFVLGCTEEVVHMPNHLVARIEGKSSCGRIGLAVHVTAGFIDPGFVGRVTLEMVNLNKVPIILYANDLIAQLSFHGMYSAAERPYQGRYQGDMGVAPSRYGKESCATCDDVGQDHCSKHGGLPA